MANVPAALRAALTEPAGGARSALSASAASMRRARGADAPAHVQFLHDTSAQRVTQRAHILALVQSALVLHGTSSEDAFPDRRVKHKLHDAAVAHTVNIRELRAAWGGTSHADARVQLLACPLARFNAAVHVALQTRALATPHGALIGATRAGVHRRDVLDALACPADVCRLACLAAPAVLDGGAPLDGHTVLPAARTATAEQVRYILRRTTYRHQVHARPIKRRQQRGASPAQHGNVRAVQHCMYVKAAHSGSVVEKVHAALRDGTPHGAPLAPATPRGKADDDAAHDAAAPSARSDVYTEARHAAHPAVLFATRGNAKASKRAHDAARKAGAALRDAGVPPCAHDIAVLLGVDAAGGARAAAGQ
uniref:Uncharacterized protein n=1 Tax=viral metagenome TaxID=1070528 RepID=A0A6C0AUF5_9ZZZZ